MLVVEIQEHMRGTLPDKRIGKPQDRQVIQRQSQRRIDGGCFASISVSSVDVGFVVHLLCHVVSSCDEGFEIRPASRCTKALQGLRIDPRRLMSKLPHVLNVRPRINSGMAVRAALTAQFQYT